MATPVIMPRQGQSVESCIIGQWYKSVGDEISEGDLLFSYETDKASFEEEAETEGTLLAIFFDEGAEVPVLSNIAVIGKKGESFEEFLPKNISSPVSSKTEGDKLQKLKNVSKIVDSAPNVRISPLAKNIANDLNIDISSIKGTGPSGRIIARDIKQASTLKASNKKEIINSQDKNRSTTKNLQFNEDYEIKTIPHIRKLIASAMHQSLQNSAQLTHHLSADARQLLEVRKKYKKAFLEKKISQNVTINDLVCYATIKALQKFPQVNTHYSGEHMKWFKKIHLGIAVDTERGLMVPALKWADDFSITGLSHQLQQLAEQARKGNINPDLLKPEEATFTISNLGNYGVEMFTPVINLPQTAILGVCTTILRPKEIQEGIYAFIPMIGLSLTYNHQALDGGEATRFLSEIKSQIENLDL